MDLKKIKDWAKRLLGMTPEPLTGVKDIQSQFYKRSAGPQGAMIGELRQTPPPDESVVDPSNFRPDMDPEDIWAESLLKTYAFDLPVWDQNSPDVQKSTLNNMKPLDRAMFLEALEIYRQGKKLKGPSFDRWLKMFHQDKTGKGII